MAEPCSCHACILAGADRPPIRLPATRREPERELHGRELVQHYAAEDELRAVIERLKAQTAK